MKTKTKNIIRDIFIFIIIYGIIYGIFSFLTLELNPLKWIFPVRFIYLCINLLILFSSIGITGDDWY